MKRKLLAVFLFVFLANVSLSGCGTSNSPSDQYQADLNNMLAAKWSSYGAGKTGFGGGLALYIVSPKGNFYAETNLPGTTKYTHFRAASTTKTYTASAIMLLAQQGKININDYLTDNIPGSTEPY